MSNTAHVLDSPFAGWTTMEEAARLAGRDHSTVRYWADNGRITWYRLGNTRVRVVNIQEVMEYSDQATRHEAKT